MEREEKKTLAAAASEEPETITMPNKCVEITELLGVMMLIIVLCINGVFSMTDFIKRQFPPENETVFTVAITAVTGLDDLARDDVIGLTTTSPPADDVVDDGGHSSSRPPPAPLSPVVFNLTFQVDNTLNEYHVACVPGVSRADVSYGGTFLAGGSVPPLCAGDYTSDRVAARASSGGSVAVPKLLRDQLAAGDASVDVKVNMPMYCRHGSCSGAVLSCKPKIGGGMSPACRLD